MIDNIQILGDVITRKLSYSPLSSLSDILLKYSGDDWKEHISLSNFSYNKKILYSNDVIDIVLISWNNNQSTKIHDHPDNGCLMRVMKGELIENIYTNDLTYLKKNILKKNNCSYLEKNYILHNISNCNDVSVSLHIYSPPNYKPNYY